MYEVKNEISRYHERTQKAEYGKLSQLMVNAKKDLQAQLKTFGIISPSRPR